MTAIMPSANDDYDDVAPGSYVDTERIETFPGDTVRVVGTASNGSKIESVSLICDAWGINQVYDRTDNDDNVFNYEYLLVVPENATFNQTLSVVVKSDNGKQTVRQIPITFLPDTQAPAVSPAFNAQVGLDFDTNTQNAIWNLEFTATDDRQLGKAVVSVPGIGLNKEIELHGRSEAVAEKIEFTSVGDVTESALVNFLDKEGRAFGAVFPLSGEMEMIEIDASTLKPFPAVVLPQDWPGVCSYYYPQSLNVSGAPDWADIEFVQISLRDDIFPEGRRTDKGIALERIALEL